MGKKMEKKDENGRRKEETKTDINKEWKGEGEVKKIRRGLKALKVIKNTNLVLSC